jgi:spore coat polysaccharide biosynthesis protein SpsF
VRPTTDQEKFWAGSFGDEYTNRNVTPAGMRTGFFRSILQRAPGIRTICELGANRGDNLAALTEVDATLDLTGVEVNAAAVEALRTQVPGATAVQSSIQDFAPAKTFDLVFTCGVLIHVDPADLPLVYDRMVDLSARYIVVNEYFSPRPVELEYRGHHNRLYKRDFAGELLDRHPKTLRVVDYGFLWRRMEPGWDDTNWTLIQKVG